MYKICKTEKSIARQRELEQGLLEYMDTVLFFDIEISELCRFLQIPRKTFYRYFGSKEDALHALIDHKITDMVRYIQTRQPDMPHHCLHTAEHFFAFWQEQHRFLDIMVKNYLSTLLTIRAVQILGTPPEHPFYESGASSVSYVKNFWISGMMAMMLQWYFEGYRTDVCELARITEALYTEPISKMPDSLP